MTRASHFTPMLLLALCCCTFGSPQLYASARSEVLRTKALLELTDGRYQQALEQLDEAVLSDPLDIQSRFYRGVTLSRLGDYPRGLEALEAISERVDGEVPRFWHELGYLHYRQEQIEQAEAAFEKAVAQEANDAGSHYYLGICRYKREAYAEAISPLEKAAELDEQYAPSAAYLRGVSMHRTGNVDGARRLLVAAAGRYPESVYAGAIADLLVTIDERRTEERPQHPLAVRIGAAHDSNVGLFADELSLPVGADSMADSRVQLDLDAGYFLQYSERQQLRLAYQFFHTAHASLDSYDLGSHSAGIDWQRTTGFGYLSSYYRLRSVTLGGDAYQTGHLLGVVGGLRHEGGRFSLASLLLSSATYADDSMSDHDLFGYTLEYRHIWPLANGGQWHLSAGIGAENANSNDYDFNQHQAGGGITWPLAKQAKLKGEVGYLFQKYPDTANTREDEEYSMSLEYSRPFAHQWTLEFTITQTEHPSTWTSYNYDRNTATLAARWQR